MQLLYIQKFYWKLSWSVIWYLLTLQWTYSLIEYFVLLKRAQKDESIRMFLFWRLQRLVLHCAQRLLMYVYFHIKMSVIRSFAKANEKSGKTKHNSQIAEEKTASNKEEPWIKPLAPPPTVVSFGSVRRRCNCSKYQHRCS